MVETGLTTVSTAAAVVQTLHALIKSSRGRKRMLLLELQHNLGVIDMYVTGRSPLNSVIGKLDIQYLKAALESDFDFNKLKRGRVNKRAAGDVAQYKGYVGWTTERLFSSIYLKISLLQQIIAIDPHSSQYRPSVRLLNIRKLIVLLIRHIGTAKP